MNESGRRIVLLGTQAFLLGLTAALLIIPASAIFLTRYGSGLLPYTYLVVAVVGAVVSLRITGALRRFSPATLAVATATALTGLIAGAWLLLRTTDAAWTSFALWVLFPLVLQLGFVFIGASAGRLLDVRQIKRLFPRIVFGFVAGFLTAGLVAIPAAALLETVDLLLLTASASACLAVAFAWGGRRYRDVLGTPDAPPPPGTPRLRPSAVLRNRYVLLIFGYQFLSAAGSQLAEFLLWDRAAARYAGPDELAAFGGALTAILNGTNILFLALAAGYLITRFGVRFGLMANPAVVALLTGVVLLIGIGPGPASGVFFLFAVGTRVVDIIFSDGTTRTAVNATLQAVPPAYRFGAQAAIEGIGVPAAMGAVGLLLIVFDAVGADTMVVVAAMGVICLAWLVAGAVAFRAYRHNLALRIRRRDLAPGDLDLTTPEAGEAIATLLSSGDPVRVRVVLDLLESADDPRLTGAIAGLLGHGDPAMVAVALERPAAADLAGPRLDDLAASPDPRVRAAAASALCAADRTVDAARLLADADGAVRVAAAIALRRVGDAPAVDLGAWVDSPDPAARVDAVRVLAAPGRLSASDLVLLDRLRADPATAPAAALVAADHPEVPLRDAVAPRTGVETQVLAARGEEGAALVAAALHGDPGPLEGLPQRRLVGAVAGMGAATAARLLVPLVGDADPGVRTASRAILVTDGVRVAPMHPAFRSALAMDRARAIGLARLQVGLSGERSLLGRSLREAWEALAREAAALADLLVGSPVASRAAVVIATGSEGEAATAEETVEVTFSGDVRTLLTALLRPGLGPDARLAMLGAEPGDPIVVMSDLVSGAGLVTDPWLRAAAVWEIRQSSDPALRAALAAADPGTDAVLEETLSAARG